MNPFYLMSLVAVLCAVALIWWLARRQGPVERPEQPAERLAYSTLKLALPGYMILSQVPIARFIDVPKRNSYGEWMRRVGAATTTPAAARRRGRPARSAM